MGPIESQRSSIVEGGIQTEPERWQHEKGSALVGYEDGGRGHKSRSPGAFWKLEKVRKQQIFL